MITGRGHRGPRHSSPVRTGFLGVSAAMAVGAVTISSGLIPSPTGLPGGFSFTGGPGDGVQANGSSSDPRTPGAGVSESPPGARSSTPADRGGDRRSTPATTAPPSRTAAPTTAAPSAKPTPSRTTAPVTRPPATAPAPTATVTRDREAVTRARVLALVNEERAKVGCRRLTADGELDTLAQRFSEDMAARGFFDHTDPDGKSPWDRAAALGITDLGGENIARGQSDAAAVMDSWMNSPGHRANILNCDYRTLGVGVHYADGGPWWTQNFGF